MKDLLKRLPPVHDIIESKQLSDMLEVHTISKSIVKEWIQAEMGHLRNQLQQDNLSFHDYSREKFILYILNQIKERAKKYYPYQLRKVINGTGTVLHTNLGRSRLSKKAMERVFQSSAYYTNLEYDLSTGKRGSRHSIIEDLLIRATGAEAAMVVNNNAAAVLLVLRGLTKGHEVVVSRGELVEIGGSFRISTIMEESDAKLVEVGTTNKTHRYDYEQAITENTKMFMKVHTSNFKTIGFTEEVSTSTLKNIALENYDKTPILVYEDLGSGSLYPFIHDGIGDEPVVKQSLENGADLISFSGDKLLGGPQAGIIAGNKDLIQQLKKHPLARVLRLDKMTLAALEATLHDYVYHQDDLKQQLPTIRDILKTQQEILTKVEEFVEKISDSLTTVKCEIIEDVSKVGGGTMPIEELPTYGISLKKLGLNANQAEKFLHESTTPLICRKKADQVFIDFRTIDAEETIVVEQIIKNLDRH